MNLSCNNFRNNKSIVIKTNLFFITGSIFITSNPSCNGMYAENLKKEICFYIDKPK